MRLNLETTRSRGALAPATTRGPKKGVVYHSFSRNKGLKFEQIAGKHSLMAPYVTHLALRLAERVVTTMNVPCGGALIRIIAPQDRTQACRSRIYSMLPVIEAGCWMFCAVARQRVAGERA